MKEVANKDKSTLIERAAPTDRREILKKLSPFLYLALAGGSIAVACKLGEYYLFVTDVYLDSRDLPRSYGLVSAELVSTLEVFFAILVALALIVFVIKLRNRFLYSPNVSTKVTKKVTRKSVPKESEEDMQFKNKIYDYKWYLIMVMVIDPFMLFTIKSFILHFELKKLWKNSSISENLITSFKRWRWLFYIRSGFIVVGFSVFLLSILFVPDQGIGRSNSNFVEGRAQYLYEDMPLRASRLLREAEDLDERGESIRAYEKIEEALLIAPGNYGLMDFKCYVQIHLEEYEAALESCLYVEEAYPNAVFTLMKISQIYLIIDDCPMSNEYSYKFSKLSGIQSVDRRILKGNAGVFLTLCDGDPDLSRTLLEEAKGLTSDRELIEAYQEHLDYLNEVYPEDEE